MNIKTKNLRKCFALSIFSLAALFLLSGCVQKNDSGQAKEYIKLSQDYYKRAIHKYLGLIAEGKDLDKLRFELGSLYYSHGDFPAAIGEFEKSPDPRARKLLAISYYRSANFTDGLEIFQRNQKHDDESLYYYGLTCEKLNLFDKALEVYNKIKGKEFIFLARQRANLIEKETGINKIDKVSPEVYKIIRSAPGQEEYPQAGALILFCKEDIEVTPADTEVSILHYVVKILNERGKENFSEASIEYDSTYEKVELVYARTIKPDGTVVDVGSRHIRDVSKYLNFPLYSNARLYIISFPEICDGASIEYKLRVYKNQLVNKKDFVLSYTLQASEPIIDANFNISVPNTKKLNIKTLNDKYNDFHADLMPKISQGAINSVYSWQFKNIPQILPEPSMPPGAEINTAIIVSTFGSWEDIYKWWRGLSGDKIKSDKAIKDKVTELTLKKESQEEKIRAIYNFCAKDIRYVAVEYGQAGYEPHQAADIFKNKYGDCKDQAILLVTMLKDAGFKAWPVLIPTKDSYNLSPDFPSILFNHCIAAVSLDNKTIFLDPTAETCSFGDLPAGDQNRRVLLIKEDTFEIQSTPLFPSQHNLAKQKLNLKINNDESVAAEKEVFTSGIYEQAQRYWLLYTPPQLIAEQLKEKIQESSIGATLKDYSIKNIDDLDKPVLLRYTFYGPEYFTVAGNLRVMPQLTVLDVALVAKDKRKYPIDFGILDEKENILEIETPSGFKARYIPESVNEDSPWLKFSSEYFYKNGKILFKQKTELKKTCIAESEYALFKIFFERLAKRIKQRVILEKIK